ncbi:hypothetical protein P3T76_007629 [Phytophthora citrophthora]|uniref:RxLR effector protein n=1 Tax=Phytophthora citrophthora TaxID=4793 RepID=A0AAD9GMM9_9STRA|nr:hypothetical protein P3T76_007629 [Phytophthora citrophthora]
MRLQYALLVLLTVLVTSNEAASVPKDKVKNVLDTDQIHSTATHRATGCKRFLRTGDTDNVVYVYDPANRDSQNSGFMEDKLRKALTNPRKKKKLYEQWYNSGFSAKTVASGLNQDENRELNYVYKKLAKGYATYAKERHQ